MSLIDSGSVGKYLLYAIGEILLVMIGILLALQVNNWNESRKDRIEEKKLLLEIRNALSADLTDQFDFHISKCVQIMNSLDLVYDNLTRIQSFHDSLASHFSIIAWEGDKDWTPQITAFEGLKSKGVDIIRNEDVKNEILNIYNLRYPKIVRNFVTYKDNIESSGRPLMAKLFTLEDNMFTGRFTRLRVTPLNYDEIAVNNEFINIVKFLKAANAGQKMMLENQRSQTEYSIQIIDNELGN